MALTRRRAIGTLAVVPALATAKEYSTIQAVVCRIIPSDSRPGACEAGVAEYVDRKVKERASLQAIYRAGIAWLEAVAMKKHGAEFARLTPARQDAILHMLDSTKDETGAKFWKSIRRLTIDGFYSSKVGLKELGYTGHSFLSEFPGCTHPEHNT